jgi:hypothetical protein
MREVGNKLQSQMTGKNRANSVRLPVGEMRKTVFPANDLLEGLRPKNFLRRSCRPHPAQNKKLQAAITDLVARLRRP